MELTAGMLREVLDYDQITGVFTWKIDVAQCVKVNEIAGSVNSFGYCTIQFMGKTYKAHRLAWLHKTGHWPEWHVDHIDGVRLNNSWANLRDVSRSVNMQNQRSARSNNSSSGLLGVHAVFKRKTDKYRAHIGVNGKQIVIGYFATAPLAHAAYLDAKRQLHEGCTL